MHAHTTTDVQPFSVNPDFDFEIRTAIGRTAAGAGDPGEILAATEQVRKNDHEGWFDAWNSLADRTAQTADTAASHGHTVSAADAYLRASAYYAVAVNALSSLDDTTRLQPTFAKQQTAWGGFLTHTTANVTAIQIPYEGDALPGYFFRASTYGTAPTLIAVNGSDGSLAGLWASCIQPALSRGYNVVAFDGPGQQSQLFNKNVPFRPDWEHVLTPVLDHILTLDGVDATKVAVYGISQGSYWVTRALAFEHRFAAGITDPGIVDVSTSWTSHLPHSLLTVLDSGDIAKFDKEMAFGMKFSPDTARTWAFRARPYGTNGYGETIQAVRAYTVADVASHITTPLLILSPENEQFWPGQAEQLANLTTSVSTVISFTAAEGADGHCQPMARALTAQRMFDWLDEQLAH
ncbi:prolyl oligopeptidase family serine peptidase [Microbacterium sp. p3-SID338]|uniref:alpha/beta hydrolase family protein n=1 Tax=Microbacterium sp. p3-SID338 TaxID=2916214 RepID=UPI0021A5CE91|nr:alpha/beta fold hydrolase [Microbacterium sp. p3-SID338]MCT1394665.1 prolyl oligopeptidase family serine peptidase [Microbacterium sp. p3-SID338]